MDIRRNTIILYYNLDGHIIHLNAKDTNDMGYMIDRMPRLFDAYPPPWCDMVTIADCIKERFLRPWVRNQEIP